MLKVSRTPRFVSTINLQLSCGFVFVIIGVYLIQSPLVYIQFLFQTKARFNGFKFLSIKFEKNLVIGVFIC